MPEIIDRDFRSLANYQGIKDIPKTIKSITDLSGSINNLENSITAEQIKNLPSEFLSSLNTLQDNLEQTENTLGTLSSDYSNFSTRLTNAVPQIVASSMFNQQITDENIKHMTKHELEQDINNKRRMTEINNYYSFKYICKYNYKKFINNFSYYYYFTVLSRKI